MQKRPIQLLTCGNQSLRTLHAAQLKLSRKTIWMWRKLSGFDEYQERLRLDRANEVAERRRQLEEKVVDALLVAIEEGDPVVTVSVAKLLWR